MRYVACTNALLMTFLVHIGTNTRKDETMKKNIKLVEGKIGYYKYVGSCVFGFGYYETAEFPKSELDKYKNGAYIQDSLVSLSDSDREFILSGISPKGWETMKEEPEDD